MHIKEEDIQQQTQYVLYSYQSLNNGDKWSNMDSKVNLSASYTLQKKAIGAIGEGGVGVQCG